MAGQSENCRSPIREWRGAKDLEHVKLRNQIGKKAKTLSERTVCGKRK